MAEDQAAAANLDLPPQPNELAELEPDLIEGFYGLDIATLAIARTGFDIYEEIERLTEIMRDPDPMISLAGLRQFRKVLKEIGEAAGRLVTAKQTIETREKDGTIVRQEIESASKLTNRIGHRPDNSFPVREQFPAGDVDRVEAVRRSGVRSGGGGDSGGAESLRRRLAGSSGPREADLREAVDEGR